MSFKRAIGDILPHPVVVLAPGKCPAGPRSRHLLCRKPLCFGLHEGESGGGIANSRCKVSCPGADPFGTTPVFPHLLHCQLLAWNAYCGSPQLMQPRFVVVKLCATFVAQLNESVPPSSSPFPFPRDGSDGPAGFSPGEKKKRAERHNDSLMKGAEDDVNEPLSP